MVALNAGFSVRAVMSRMPCCRELRLVGVVGGGWSDWGRASYSSSNQEEIKRQWVERAPVILQAGLVDGLGWQKHGVN